jgi:hypothetical protein
MGYMSCFERVAMQATMSRDQTLLTNTHSLQLWNFALQLNSQRVTQRLPLVASAVFRVRSQ